MVDLIDFFFTAFEVTLFLAVGALGCALACGAIYLFIWGVLVGAAAVGLL